MKTLGLILILFKISNCLACRPPAPPPYTPPTTRRPPAKVTPNITAPKKVSEHWIPPPDSALLQYDSWIADYKKRMQQKLDDELKAKGINGSWPDRPEHAGSDWPAHWKGLGPGSSGVAPPPWAYIEKSSGKADMCFMSPKRGPCTDFEVRWGFNPYVDDCRQFVYGGCEANLNNFMNKRRCREACLGTPVGNCVSGPDLTLDNINFPMPDDGVLAEEVTEKSNDNDYNN